MNYEIALCAEESVKMFKETLQEGYLYDCIFIKLIMPGMSGFDATKEFRKLEKQFGISNETRHYICGTSAEVTDRKCMLFYQF